MGLLIGSPENPSASVSGTLARDGVATPHQIALIVENLNSLSQSATAEVRVRTNSPQGSWSSWIPVMRVQPTESPTPPWAGGVEDVFAWSIFGLQPGTTYDVELRKTLGASVDDGNLSQFTTKALPPEPGAPDVTIAAGTSIANINTALAGASPGDVIQFDDGTYLSNGIVWPTSLSGLTEAAPTYIVGESRTGVIFDNSANNDNAVIRLTNTLSNVVFQNFTCNGAGLDSTPALEGSAAFFANGVSLENITMRRFTGTNLQKGIEFRGPVNQTADIHGIMAYDCTLQGTLVYNETNLRTASYGWDNYAVLVAGDGHAFFNMTLSGFGDIFSPTSGASGSRSERDRAQFWYWNDVSEGFDDAVEFDDGYRNLWGYQNRFRQVTNLCSYDLLYGGPGGMWGNLYLAPLESRIIKYNSNGSGAVFAQNTVSLRSQPNRSDAGATDYALWYNPPGGDMSNNIFVNNVFIKTAGTLTNGPILVENTLVGDSDWCNNAWFPDGAFFIYDDDGNIDAANLAGAQADAGAARGVLFDKQVLEDDGISVIQPFATSISYPATPFVPITEDYTFADFAPNHASINDTGLSFPGFTDNINESFSGAAPAKGCVVTGLTNPVVGDQTSGVPSYASGMSAYDVRQLTGVYAPSSGDTTMEDVTPAGWVSEASNPGRAFSGVISAYSGGAGVTVSTTADGRLVVHGGGHNDSGNNGFYVYDPRESGGLPTGWESPLDITTKGTETQGTTPTYSDGRPRSVHTYDSMLYAPDRNLYYRMGGAIFEGNGGFTDDFWEYDPTAAIGSRWMQLTDWPGSTSDTTFAYYDQATGKIIGLTNGTCYIYDIDAGTWSSAVTITANSGFDGAGGYDPTRNNVIVQQRSNDSARLYTFNLSTDTQTSSSAITWTGSTTLINSGAPAHFYDSLLDRFWVIGGDNTANYDTIAYYDAADLALGGSVAVTEVALSANMAATGFEEAIIGTFGRYLFVEESRLIYTVHRTDEAPWIVLLPSS